jgi:multisubunit Na+/H+ antiporter MnhC subunit
MWRARYWAVLGMQAILAIVILIFGILVFTASNAVTVLIALAVMAPAGALFYFLVKSLARIQMPDRRPR